MRIVIALGGNVLLKRGEPLTMQAQRRKAHAAAQDGAPGRHACIGRLDDVRNILEGRAGTMVSLNTALLSTTANVGAGARA